MCSHWIQANPKDKAIGCWSCESNACAEAAKAKRHWCKPCGETAIAKLKEKSGFECETWDDDFAETYLQAVRDSMTKRGVQPDAKKDPPPETVDKKGTNKEVDLTGGECELCGVACGNDRVGRTASKEPPPGTPVFHRKCRSKIFKWWLSDPGCIASVKALALDSREQWNHVVKRAKRVRLGKATLEVANDNTKEDLVDTLQGLSSLAGEGEMKAGLTAMSKMLLGTNTRAKATPKDRRWFGLDRFPWDLRDLAVEQAEKRGGRYAAEAVKKAVMDRDAFMWFLLEGTSLDAASSDNGRQLMQAADESGQSRRYREDAMYQLLEGLCRLLLEQGEKRIKGLSDGQALWDMITRAKANARYAQQRIQWVRDDDIPWAKVEESERLQLEQSVLRKHKTGKVLTRAKLHLLMTETREAFLETAIKAGNSGGNDLASRVKAQRLQITQMQKKLTLTNKRANPFTTPKPLKKGKRGTRAPKARPFCKWCKRAERHHLIYHHDSKDCNKKPPGQ